MSLRGSVTEMCDCSGPLPLPDGWRGSQRDRSLPESAS